MQYNQNNQTIEINGTFYQIEEISEKLSQQKPDEVSDIFKWFNIQFPRKVRMDAMRQSLRPGIVKTRSECLLLDSQLNYRLLWFSKFSEEQMNFYFTYFKDANLNIQFAKRFYKALIITLALNKDQILDDCMFALINLANNPSTYHKIDIKSFNQTFDWLFIDVEGEIDGLTVDAFRPIVFNSATKQQILNIGHKFGVTIPEKINKNNITTYAIEKLKAMKVDTTELEINKDKWNMKTVKEFSESHGLKILGELNKKDAIEYILQRAKETKDNYAVPETDQVYEMGIPISDQETIYEKLLIEKIKANAEIEKVQKDLLKKQGDELAKAKLEYEAKLKEQKEREDKLLKMEQKLDQNSKDNNTTASEVQIDEIIDEDDAKIDKAFEDLEKASSTEVAKVDNPFGNNSLVIYEAQRHDLAVIDQVFTSKAKKISISAIVLGVIISALILIIAIPVIVARTTFRKDPTYVANLKPLESNTLKLGNLTKKGDKKLVVSPVDFDTVLEMQDFFKAQYKSKIGKSKESTESFDVVYYKRGTNKKVDYISLKDSFIYQTEKFGNDNENPSKLDQYSCDDRYDVEVRFLYSRIKVRLELEINRKNVVTVFKPALDEATKEAFKGENGKILYFPKTRMSEKAFIDNKSAFLQTIIRDKGDYLLTDEEASDTEKWFSNFDRTTQINDWSLAKFFSSYSQNENNGINLIAANNNMSGKRIRLEFLLEGITENLEQNKRNRVAFLVSSSEQIDQIIAKFDAQKAKIVAPNLRDQYDNLDDKDDNLRNTEYFEWRGWSTDDSAKAERRVFDPNTISGIAGARTYAFSPLFARKKVDIKLRHTFPQNGIENGKDRIIPSNYDDDTLAKLGFNAEIIESIKKGGISVIGKCIDTANNEVEVPAFKEIYAEIEYRDPDVVSKNTQSWKYNLPEDNELDPCKEFRPGFYFEYFEADSIKVSNNLQLKIDNDTYTSVNIFSKYSPANTARIKFSHASNIPALAPYLEENSSIVAPDKFVLSGSAKEKVFDNGGVSNTALENFLVQLRTNVPAPYDQFVQGDYKLVYDNIIAINEDTLYSDIQNKVIEIRFEVLPIKFNITRNKASFDEKGNATLSRDIQFDNTDKIKAGFIVPFKPGFALADPENSSYFTVTELTPSPAGTDEANKVKNLIVSAVNGLYDQIQELYDQKFAISNLQDFNKIFANYDDLSVNDPRVRKEITLIFNPFKREFKFHSYSPTNKLFDSNDFGATIIRDYYFGDDIAAKVKAGTSKPDQDFYGWSFSSNAPSNLVSKSEVDAKFINPHSQNPSDQMQLQTPVELFAFYDAEKDGKINLVVEFYNTDNQAPDLKLTTSPQEIANGLTVGDEFNIKNYANGDWLKLSKINPTGTNPESIKAEDYDGFILDEPNSLFTATPRSVKKDPTITIKFKRKEVRIIFDYDNGNDFDKKIKGLNDGEDLSFGDKQKLIFGQTLSDFSRLVPNSDFEKIQKENGSQVFAKKWYKDGKNGNVIDPQNPEADDEFTLDHYKLGKYVIDSKLLEDQIRDENPEIIFKAKYKYSEYKVEIKYLIPDSKTNYTVKNLEEAQKYQIANSPTVATLTFTSKDDHTENIDPTTLKDKMTDLHKSKNYEDILEVDQKDLIIYTNHDSKYHESNPSAVDSQVEVSEDGQLDIKQNSDRNKINNNDVVKIYLKLKYKKAEVIFDVKYEKNSLHEVKGNYTLLIWHSFNGTYQELKEGLEKHPHDDDYKEALRKINEEIIPANNKVDLDKENYELPIIRTNEANNNIPLKTFFKDVVFNMAESNGERGNYQFDLFFPRKKVNVNLYFIKSNKGNNQFDVKYKSSSTVKSSLSDELISKANINIDLKEEKQVDNAMLEKYFNNGNPIIGNGYFVADKPYNAENVGNPTTKIFAENNNQDFFIFITRKKLTVTFYKTRVKKPNEKLASRNAYYEATILDFIPNKPDAINPADDQGYVAHPEGFLGFKVIRKTPSSDSILIQEKFIVTENTDVYAYK